MEKNLKGLGEVVAGIERTLARLGEEGTLNDKTFTKEV